MVETFSIPQTQRLLAGLIEERVLHNQPKNGENGTKFSKLKCKLTISSIILVLMAHLSFSASDFAKLKSSAGGQKLGTCLDRRLKKELMEQGILTLEDITKVFRLYFIRSKN